MKSLAQYIITSIFLFGTTLSGRSQSSPQTSLTSNGVLVCSNLPAGSVATVEWAPSLNGPWRRNWDGLSGITVDTSGSIIVNVPMFFRVSTAPPAGMVLIPSGSFLLGDALDGENDAKPVATSLSGFYMDINLVCYSQWQTNYSWATNNGYSFTNPGMGKAPDHPVQTVSWFDSVKWCNARSIQSGLTPVYYTDANLSRVYTNGNVLPFVKWQANGFRLPTEAEWERSARGGLLGRFPNYDYISEIDANYRSFMNLYFYDLGPYTGFNTYYSIGAQPYTSPVGAFTSYGQNGYGLYDMAGNVFQWCWDWYGIPYAGGQDPHGPTSGGYRVLRGGSWINDASFARCANRTYEDPNGSAWSFGFRCVRGH